MATYALGMVGDSVKSAGYVTTDNANIPPGKLECTEAQYNECKDSISFPGVDVFRWTFINNVLAEIIDVRRVGTWGPDGVGSVVNGNAVYDLEQGDPEPTVTLTITPGAINGEQLIQLDRLGPIKVTAVNGVATISIKTDVARQFEVPSTDLLQMANKLRVRVSAIKI